MMRYHVAVSLTEGYILHFFGPFQGASNDLNLLHSSGFLDMRDEDEWTLGDGIYSCKFHHIFSALPPSAQPRFLCPVSKTVLARLDGDRFDEVKTDSKIISAVRSMVERVIRCIKCWKIMKGPFRGFHWRNHGIVALAVFQLVQWQFMTQGHPTFDENLFVHLFPSEEDDSDGDIE